MIEEKILWKGLLTEDRVKVNMTERSNRKINPIIENKLKSCWEQNLISAQARGTILYDGISYRLENMDYSDGQLLLTVSPIHFSVRSTLKKMPELDILGEDYYSHGLSIGGFVETMDGFYVFARKSNLSASSLKEDIVGGVLEVIEPVSGEGILNMNRREIKEELNVSPDLITDMKIIGFVRSSTTDIVIVTQTRLSLTKAQLEALFAQREDKELEAIVFIEPSNLQPYLNQLGSYKPTMAKLLPQ